MTEREYARGEYQRTLWWAAWKQVEARAEEL
jgi:hypothetical protein